MKYYKKISQYLENICVNKNKLLFLPLIDDIFYWHEEILFVVFGRNTKYEYILTIIRSTLEAVHDG